MNERKKIIMKCLATVLGIVLLMSVCACGVPAETVDTSGYAALSTATTENSIIETEYQEPEVIGAWLCNEDWDTILVLNDDLELYWVGISDDSYHYTTFKMEGTYSFTDNKIIVADWNGDPYQVEITYDPASDAITLGENIFTFTRANFANSRPNTIVGDWHLYNPYLDGFGIDLDYIIDVSAYGSRISFYLDNSFAVYNDYGEIRDNHCYGTYERIFGGSTLELNAGGATGLIKVKSLGCGVMVLTDVGGGYNESYLFYKFGG